jgi:threonine/homoserine/homoserine lactone efflux protein
MTGPGRAAMLVVVAWLLGAVALLAAQGVLVPYLLAVGAATLAGLGLRALVRQQRGPLDPGAATAARTLPGGRRPRAAHRRRGGRGRA